MSSIAQSFEQKGYTLADKFILNANDEISNLDVILGNNDAQILPQTEMLFGSNIPSGYADTPRGVMLTGSIHRLQNSIEELPDVTEHQCIVEPCGVEVELNYNPPVTSKETYQLSCKENESVENEILTAAVEDILKQSYFLSNQYTASVNNSTNESDARLNIYVLNNTSRTNEGRLVMPLLWRDEVSHLLAHNFNLSKQILKSNFKKLKNDSFRVQMYDEVIKEQVKLGVIEKIPDLTQFLNENPTASFLPHMGIFRMNKETTKCRVVFLSNLAENNRI